MADLTITAANVSAASDAVVARGTSAVALTAGQAVYADSTNGNKITAADANAAVSAAAVGIALNDAPGAGQPVNWIKSGDFNPGSTVSVATIYCVSDTAGGVKPSADLATGEFVTTLGIGTTATNIAVQVQVSGKAVP